VSKWVFVGSDHNGNAARNYILKVLRSMPEVSRVEDCGQEEGKVDYPIMAMQVCGGLQLSSNPNTYGILICGTGTGMCIAANKLKYIRAGLATDRATAELMREHNDCNVLCLGQWRNSLSQMEEMVRAFLETPFGAGRHERRLQMLRDLDECILI
jgi:ribose 5-phosphate isomerase B